jgi:hypothetical protein
MEAARTSETSVYFNETTRRYILENSKLHTRRRENLKSHKASCIYLSVGEMQLQVVKACGTRGYSELYSSGLQTLFDHASLNQ